MASGLVAKKIALFELKPPTTEHHCRLKRKHAIRRKKYRRDRKSISLVGSVLEALSDENLEHSSSYSSSDVTSSLSASCSALLDLIYQPQITRPPTTLMIAPVNRIIPSINMKDKNKTMFCRSSSLEIFPTRLNIVDIDIEIRVEKKSPSPASPDVLYEPLEPSESNLIDKIKITATMDSHSHMHNPGSAVNNTSPNHYYCTSCGTCNNSNTSNRNSDNFDDHIYENFSLIPPPRPPKRLFGGSLSTNYNYNSYSTESTKTKLSSLTLGTEKGNKTEEINENKHTEVQDEEDETREPFYEDLYDYCNTPGFCLDNDESILPVAVTSFVDNDKDEEVEYCDCSTVMAMAINSLNNREPVSFIKAEDAPYLSTKIGKEQIKTDETNEQKSRETKGSFYSDNRRSSATSLIKSVDEFMGYSNTAHSQISSVSKYGNHYGKTPSELYGRTHLSRIVDEAGVTNDSKDKKDEDEPFKPLPIPPETSSSSASSSDSFYSEPIYGITNQITNGNILKNPGPPVPDTLKRPSLSPNPHANNISCNNVLRSPPVPSPAFVNKVNNNPSIASGSIYGYGGSMADYADSVTIPTPNNARPSIDNSNFAPNDKLPPIPPSKFSSIAKSAGRRIARKILAIRKTSKSSLDNYEAPSSSSSSTNGSITGRVVVTPHSNPSPKTVSGKSTPTGSNTGSQSQQMPQLKRAISRPNIPPPEPPKCPDGVSSNGSTNNYSIYGKSEVNRNEGDDDDFDDSDFYDSDSELIKNFVSQVQPIYSMEEEPLYQYYAYGISIKPDDDYQPVIPKNLGLSLDMLVPRVGQRTLWCELPEVTASGILSILSDKQKQLQEAIFEILTSEVSYLKSLDVLIMVFYKNEELIGVLTEEERGYLFGNIEEVRDSAQAFLAELLAKWNESWYIQDIGEAINTNANTRFSVYKEYCRNKPYQDKTMQRLRHSRDEFVNVIKTLEEDSKCQMLRVDSFLMLPMQRITRLPLLVNAVIQRTTSVKEKAHCEEALKSLTNLVLACNEAARESQDAEETSAVLDKLEYPRGARNPVTLGQFIMKGDFMKNPFDQGRNNQVNWTFRKTKRTFYWVLLFSNQLLVTKRKTNGRYEVLDTAMPEDSSIKPLPNLEGVANDFQHFFMLHFNKKETVYFLAARTNSEVERWKTKLDSMKTDKKLQVEAIFPYESRRADELSFNAGDLIEVSQMQPDGWYYGSKVNGGQMGWFPGNYCCEV